MIKYVVYLSEVKYMYIRIMLFVSSNIPLIIMIFLNHMELFSIQEIGRVFNLNSYFWLLMIFLIVISLGSFFYWLLKLKDVFDDKNEPPQLDQIRVNEDEVLSYFITFIVPLISLDITNSPSIIMNLILISIICIYYVKNNKLHYNIWLIILGYRIYNDQFGNIILSKDNLYEIFNSNLGNRHFPNLKFYRLK